jgi:hypothetical protein
MNMPNTSAITQMNAEQRRRALAIILSRGVLRYNRRIRQLKSGYRDNFSDSSAGGLEVLGETRLSVSERTRG